MPSQPPVRRRGPPSSAAGPRRFVIEPVEPRLLYSADFAAAFSGGAAGVGGLFDERRLEAPALQAPPLQAAPRAEIALVDGRLPAADGRLAELQARRQAGQPLEVVTLQPGEDGIARATELLRGRADVGALHLVGHSVDGTLQLGRATLDAPTLLARAGELAAWGQALAPGAQLLLPGSDGPAGSPGAALRAGLAALTGAEVAAAAPRALIVVAANLPDSAQLVAGLKASSPGDVEVLVLAADRDGLAQIGERLAQAGRPFDAVHLVSHAAPGRVDLGTTVGDRWLDEATLQARHEELARWSTGFTAEGDLLLYGCDLAGSAAGERLLAGLGATLGVDVAASTDATGAAAQGADWALEYQLGEVAAAAPLAATAWTFTLASVTANRFTDVVDGNTSSISALLANPGADGGISLREAVQAANGNAAGDIITLLPGTYSLGSTLTVSRELEIIGAGAGQSVVDGGGGARLITVDGGSLKLKALTLQGGAAGADNGGALFVLAGLSVVLDDVALVGNTAASGGAVYSQGTLTATNVSFVGNKAGQLGGALFVEQGTAALTNATLSGNAASTNAGAIYTNRPITLTHATVAYNEAGSGVGGIVLGGGGQATLSNTILAENAGANASGVLTSSGFNLDTDGTAGLSAGTDLESVAARLNPLSVSASGIHVHTLQSSSPAIDAGGGASDFDALGVERNQIPDIGASENRAASRAKLYWAEQDTDSIWRANTDGSAQQRLVTGLSDPRGVAVDLTNGFVYWSETGTPDAIRRANLDGSEVTSIATTGLHGPFGLALDAAGGRLYYADNGSSGNDHIERIDLTGANRTDLFALHSIPSDVALDVGHGYLYAAERNSGQLVSRAIDGSGASTVLFSGAGSGMTNVREIEIDTVDRMLYWVGGDAMNDTIYRGRPDGTGLEMLIGGLDQAHGLALDLAAGRMYWNEYGGSMGSARLDGTDRVSFAIPAGDVRDLDILTLPAVNQAPEGADKTVTTAEDTPATLKPADFGFFDSDGQAFAGVVITSAPMPSQGILWLGSTKVSDGDFIEVEAIQAGKLVFVPAANANGSNAASFKFQVSDGGPELDPTPNTLSFDITPVDDAPTLTLSTAGSSWVEGQSPVMLDAALTLGDVDHTLLGGASVAIAGGFTAGDRLHVTPPVGVIAGYNHNTGVLTLTGQATLADYQAALRSVAFSSDSEHPTSAGTTRTVSWTVSDGALGSPVQTSTVSVTGVNDAPSGADKTIALLEDTPHTVTVADFGFSDVDDGLFTGVYIASPPGAGNVLALDGTTVSAGQWISAAQIADGKLRFTPAANANGPNLASFTFGVQDDGGMANGGVDTDATPNRLSFDVTAVNDAPTVTPFADLLLNEDFSTRTISFTVGDVESGAASLTVTAESSDTSIVQPPTLSGASADRTIRLQSMAHAFGTATVTVTVSDGVNSTSASFAVQVSPLNDAPQVVGTSATLAAVAEDTPSPAGRLISDLLAANYSDARDGIYATPMAGVAVVGIEGSDERGSWQYSAGGSTGWTSMPGSGLSETSAVILPSTYWLRFLPAPDFNGDPGALRLRLADGSQGAIALPTVQSLSGNWGGTKVWSASSVFLKTDVVAANDRPEALGPATLPAIDEDTASPPGVRVDELFAGSYTDAADADQWSDLAGVAIAGNAATAAQGRWQHSANGTDGWTAIRASGLSDEAALVLPASHWLRFVPSANWAGTPGELSVRLADGSQGAVGLGTAVNLTDGLGETGIWSDDLVPLGTEVTPVNDAPVAADDTRTIAEDGMLNDSVAGLVTDVDGSSFTYAIVGETPAGLVFDAATGNYTYTPAANFHGALSFQYKASDGVADSNVATVSINVTPVNDAPVIELPPVLQARANSPLQLMREAGLRITDVDATSFTVTLATTGGVPIRLVPDSLDDLVSHSGNGTDTVTIEGTKINVNRAVNGMVLDMGASGLIGLTVTVSDNGGAGVGGPLIATASSLIDVTPGAMPQVTTTAGPVTFTEDDPGLVVDPGLTVTDSDSAQLTQARVTIMLGFRAGDLLQATSLPGGITQSWDEASRVLTLSGTTSVANYQAALRSVSFSNSSQSPSTATRTLAFVVDDGKGPSLAATREVKVVAVNDAPTLALPMADQSVAEDSAFTFAVPANTFADVDVGDTFVYTATKADGTALPAWLSFDAATRRFSGMPTNDDVGPVTLRVTATDAAGAQASGSFTLTVVNANDAPTLAAPIAGQTATEGSIFSFAVPANTFGDVDAGDALTYTATQADGTALPAWLRFEAATMGFRGAPQRLDAGPLNIRVTATDRAGQSAAGGFRIDVVALPFVSPAPAAPTSPAPVFVTPPPAPAPASASNPVAVPPPAAMPAPAPSPATDPASASLTSGGRAPSPEPATLAPVAAPAPANAAASSDSRAPASGAPGASESPVAAAPAGAKAQASSPDAPSSPAPSGDGAKAAAATPGDADAAVAKEPAGAVAANAPATAGGPGAPAGQAPPAVSRGANPAAEAVAAVGRWVAGSGLGGSLATPAPMQPSLSWAPIGQLGLERGAFDSALGLGSSSPGDGTASQRVDNSFRQLREDAQEEAVVEQGVVASSVVVSTGFSVGYVLWLARGGALLASLASAIPAWAMVDPMPVLSKQRPGGRGPHAQGPDPDADNDGMGAPDDEVEDMFDAGSRAGASSTPPPLATPPLPAAATQPAAEARP